MAAAMVNSLVLVLLNLIALPFYVQFLGVESYGLIGFYVTLQVVLQVLDLGLAPTVSREIATGAATGSGFERRSASLLRTLGVVYLAVALCIAAFLVCFAPAIAAGWLQSESIPAATVEHAVALMGITIACRWPIGLYHGALSGAHRLATSSFVSIVVNVSAVAATLAVLAWKWQSIEAFFVVQICFGVLHLLILRSLALSAIGARSAPYDFADLLRVWRFSAWMSCVAIAGLLLSQADKLVLSRVLDLEEFGYYMLATQLSMGLSVLTGPAYAALYPKFASLLAHGRIAELADLYSAGARLFTAALFSLAAFLVFQSESFLTIWLRDPEVAATVAPVAALLGLGTALNGVMYFPYVLQLAAGRPQLAFMVAGALLLAALPLTVVLATRYGGMGGGLAWVILGVVYLFLGTWSTGRFVQSFAGLPWLARSVLVPAIVAPVPAASVFAVSAVYVLSPMVELILGLLAVPVGTGIAALVSLSPSGTRRLVKLITSHF